MARVRSKEPEDQQKASNSRRTPAPDTSSLRESDQPSLSVPLTMQSAPSLHTLQRTVGNRAVVDMIANTRAKASPAVSVQREGETPRSARGGNRLYVGNLSFGTTQATVQTMFSEIGEVREVSMPTDRETGQPRGFAFVTMGNSQVASMAIAQLDGQVLDGRPIRVNEAQDRPARGGGGGFGGGGGGGGGRGGGGGGGGRGGGGRGGRDRY